MASTSDLIQFILGTGYREVPAAAILKIKLHILDCLGVTLAASRRPIAQIVVSQVEANAGTAEASVIGHDLRVPCAEAAWANGVIGHALDFDDNSIDLPTAIHQTVTALPAALSVAEHLNAGGAELLRAVALGIEAASKVNRAVNGCRAAYHGTGIFGTLSSAVAAGVLLELEPARLEHALATASSMAAGLEANFGTMTKPLHAGQASRDGVVAALLATRGFTGARGILERKGGFADVIGTRLDPDYLRRHLGNPWEVLEPGIHLKAYPSCMLTHPGLDAVLELARAYDIDAEAVEAVEVVARRDLREVLTYDQPTTGLEGKFSMPFCVAIGLIERRATLREFTDASVREARVIDLERRVRCSVDPSLPGSGSLATLVKVTTAQGRTYEKLVEYPRGSKHNPMAPDEVAEKFRSCAGVSLADETIEELIKLTLHLEEVKRVKVLTQLLSSPVQARRC